MSRAVAIPLILAVCAVALAPPVASAMQNTPPNSTVAVLGILAAVIYVALLASAVSKVLML